MLLHAVTICGAVLALVLLYRVFMRRLRWIGANAATQSGPYPDRVLSLCVRTASAVLLVTLLLLWCT